MYGVSIVNVHIGYIFFWLYQERRKSLAMVMELCKMQPKVELRKQDVNKVVHRNKARLWF
jgi:hypothetical protein